MNPQLLLDNIRSVLMRLEETILFALIERARFRHNPPIYRPGVFGQATGGRSLLDFLLRETEITHAKMRRYTSPDEKPFCAPLPDPILPALHYRENPLETNDINLNGPIRKAYLEQVVPAICEPGDDGQYGSSAVGDVTCLQNLSHRIHYGLFVAESKFRASPDAYAQAIRAGEPERVRALVTDEEVEERLLRRVEMKARRYGQDVGEHGATTVGSTKVSPATVRRIYQEVIIPLTKDVEVAYLFECKNH